MKTAISVPDELFIKVNNLARKLKQPRSRLYAAAMSDFLKKYDGANVTLQLDDIYDKTTSSLDPIITSIQTRSLPSDPYEKW